VVALILRRDEQANKYREILKKIAAEILGKITDGTFKKALPLLYKELAKV
jgi:hypothetical protein